MLYRRPLQHAMPCCRQGQSGGISASSSVQVPGSYRVLILAVARTTQAMLADALQKVWGGALSRDCGTVCCTKTERRLSVDIPTQKRRFCVTTSNQA